MKFEVWGLTGTLVTQYERDASFAQERLWSWIDRIDAACNRFRPDSEIARVNAANSSTFVVSETFATCLNAALASATLTNGLCDPTVLEALCAIGYDRDFDAIAPSTRALAPSQPSPGLNAIEFDPASRRLRLAHGCRLDFGASAKALVADAVADELAVRGGVVVEIGGDVALRGSGPEGPWAVAISDRLELHGNEPRVSLQSGGIATSSITARTWRMNGRVMNHIIDPRTGDCASGPYATASVSAQSCVIANAFATAALLWGEDAGYRIGQSGWSARLVRRDGRVEFIGGWPEDALTA